ncbi:MAG: lysophospholipid acyltransferase family protein, partial [Alphaproteobacteria bacterium]
MRLVRSLLFNLSLVGWTVGMALVCLPALVMPRRATLAVLRGWVRGVMWLLAHVVGLRYEIRGWQHVPGTPAIFAVKHQSMWETLVFAILRPDFAGVYKRELLWVPLYGWFLWKADMIAIDRRAGAGALRRMVREAKKRVAAGRSLWVAPQGTRVEPGVRRPYQRGIAALYRGLDIPVVPVALNSGLFWGRRSFIKHPGVVTLEFLAPIRPGLDVDRFMAELERRIET